MEKHMTDAQTLLQLAARCRRMAECCTTAAIARKFEALALDYEEHARRLRAPVTDTPEPTLLEPTTGRPQRAGASRP